MLEHSLTLTYIIASHFTPLSWIFQAFEGCAAFLGNVALSFLNNTVTSWRANFLGEYHHETNLRLLQCIQICLTASWYLHSSTTFNTKLFWPESHCGQMNFVACKPCVHILTIHYMSNKCNCNTEVCIEWKWRKAGATLWNLWRCPVHL